MAAGLSNPSPVVHRPSPSSPGEQYDPLVSEIFDLIRDIKDPEHPHTLEELNVIKESDITLCHRPLPSHSSAGPYPPSTLSADQPLSSPVSQRQSTDLLVTGAAASLVTSSFTDDEEVWIRVQFTPTVPHCSLATLIGLCLRVKLERSLQRSFKLDIFVNEGSHSIEEDVNKQINDKERVAAAMENPNLREMVEECIKEVDY